MHLVTDSPGAAPDMKYSALPVSLSPSVTLPDWTSLPALEVVAVNAPKTPSAARLPSTPTTSTERSTLYLFLILAPFLARSAGAKLWARLHQASPLLYEGIDSLIGCANTADRGVF